MPYTRGAEYSRPAAQILDEARAARRARARARSPSSGQNVNAYHGDAPDGGEWGLGELVRALAEIAGLDRIRYTTSHPRDVDDGLIAAHRDVPQLMPFLHLPVQSGSDRVLAAMNRRHTAADYRRTVERLRAARPDLALSSDFIVGFPGESDADFRGDPRPRRRDRLRPGVFVQVFAAPRHAGGRAPRTRCPSRSKAERLAALQALLAQQQRDFNAACVGRVLPVLFEKPGRHQGQLVGRSPYLQSVHVPAAADRGRRDRPGR